MQPLAWLVTWQSMGRPAQARFRTAVAAEAWRQQHQGEARPLVAREAGDSTPPVAWLIVYGAEGRHSWITDADRTAAALLAASVHGLLTPLVLAPV